jgi:hypothetical protein
MRTIDTAFAGVVAPAVLVATPALSSTRTTDSLMPRVQQRLMLNHLRYYSQCQPGSAPSSSSSTGKTTTAPSTTPPATTPSSTSTAPASTGTGYQIRAVENPVFHFVSSLIANVTYDLANELLWYISTSRTTVDIMQTTMIPHLKANIFRSRRTCLGASSFVWILRHHRRAYSVHD